MTIKLNIIIIVCISYNLYYKIIRKTLWLENTLKKKELINDKTNLCDTTLLALKTQYR